MKKMAIIMMATVFFLAGTALVLAQMHQKNEMQEMHPSEQQMQWFCPWCGSANDQGAGSGMMRGQHMMQQSRDMHHGWGRGQCPMGKSGDMAPISKDDANMLMKNYVSGNPNLKIGDIIDKDDVYVGEIVTKDGSPVEKLIINKKTGWMKRTY